MFEVRPESPQGNAFLYGLRNPLEAINRVREFGAAGLYTIVNETVDVNDGGVSGVVQGEVIEFAPGGTPRVVDEADPASVEKNIGLEMLRLVYGFKPSLDFRIDQRIEFSIHPVRRGWRNEHTIIWELEDLPFTHVAPYFRWPNRFSHFIGDKVFGLLFAHLHKLHVPRSLVISRGLKPFEFGTPTTSDVRWLRTGTISSRTRCVSDGSWLDRSFYSH